MSRPKLSVDLTDLHQDDAPFLLELLNSKPYLQFVGDRGVSTVDDAQRYLTEYFLASQRKYGFGYQVVRNSDNQAIGMVGLMKREELDYPDLGFAFLPEYFGQGYALMACQQYLRAIKQEGKLHTIVAFTDQLNSASQRLLERLGFELECAERKPTNSCIYRLDL